MALIFYSRSKVKVTCAQSLTASIFHAVTRNLAQDVRPKILFYFAFYCFQLSLTLVKLSSKIYQFRRLNVTANDKSIITETNLASDRGT